MDAEAAERTNRWATALAATPLEIRCSAGGDDYTETMALLERGAPLPPNLIDDVDRTMGWLDAQVSGLTGGKPAQQGEWVHAPGTPAGYFRASYLVGRERLQVTVLPDGDKTVFMVLSHLEAEELIYAPLFDELHASLQVGAVPLNPFDLSGLRTFNFIGWLLALFVAYGVALGLFSERKGDHARVGRIAAAGLVGLAVLAALIVFVALGDAAAALEAVGSSVSSVATEVFGVGVAAAGVAFGLGTLLQSDEGVVRSAPDAKISLSRRIEAAEAERELVEDEPTRVGPAPTPPKARADGGPDNGPRKPPPKPPDGR